MTWLQFRPKFTIGNFRVCHYNCDLIFEAVQRPLLETVANVLSNEAGNPDSNRCRAISFWAMLLAYNSKALFEQLQGQKLLCTSSVARPHLTFHRGKKQVHRISRQNTQQQHIYIMQHFSQNTDSFTHKIESFFFSNDDSNTFT